MDALFPVSDPSGALIYIIWTFEAVTGIPTSLFILFPLTSSEDRRGSHIPYSFQRKDEAMAVCGHPACGRGCLWPWLSVAMAVCSRSRFVVSRHLRPPGGGRKSRVESGPARSQTQPYTGSSVEPMEDYLCPKTHRTSLCLHHHSW